MKLVITVTDDPQASTIVGSDYTHTILVQGEGKGHQRPFRMLPGDPPEVLYDAVWTAVKWFCEEHGDARQHAPHQPPPTHVSSAYSQTTVAPDELQGMVGEWADRTFVHSTPMSITRHLRREVNELVAAVVSDGQQWAGAGSVSLALKERVGDELGDCMNLLLHLAHQYGVSLDAETKRVYHRNQERRWGPPDAEGVSEHL